MQRRNYYSSRTRPLPLRRYRAAAASFLCAFALLLVPHNAVAVGSRSKTDIVHMKNGDKITCEIKSLEKGQLTVKPDYTSSTIVLDWEKVDHVESKQDFVVTDPKGAIYSGVIEHDEKTKDLTIIGSDTTRLPNISVIEIEELGGSFWKRMRGNIDFGLSFAKSNSQKNVSLQGGLNYQSREYLFSLDSNSQFTSQQQTNDTNETNIKSALYKRLRRSNWYYGGIGNFLSSTAQQIDLRSTLGATLNSALSSPTAPTSTRSVASPSPSNATHRERQAPPAAKPSTPPLLCNIPPSASTPPPSIPPSGSTPASPRPGGCA